MFDGTTPSYVLDEFDREEHLKKIKRIKRQLGDVSLDVKDLDFEQMRLELISLAEAVEVLALQAQQGPSPPDGSANELVAAESTLLAVTGSGFPSLMVDITTTPDYANNAFPVVFEHGDKQLEEALYEFVIEVGTLEAKEPAMARYFLMFAPNAEQLRTEKPTFLRRVFEFLRELMERVLRMFTKATNAVWDILTDPDAYYLRLRGEVAELQRCHPGYAWLEYLLLLPDTFRLFVRLLLDERVSWETKGPVLGALTYLVLPVDLIPEGLLGPVGYVEDVFLMAKTIVGLLDENRVSVGLLQEHWSGEPEMLRRLLQAAAWFDEHTDFFRRLNEWFKGRTSPA